MGHCWMRTPVSGPLAPYVPGFAGELASRGYSKWTIAKLVRLGAILSRWLEEREREADELSPALLKEYLLAGHKAGWRMRTARAYAPLLGYLHAIGVMAEPEPTELVTAAESLLDSYQTYLVRERGMPPTTAVRYTATAAPSCRVEAVQENSIYQARREDAGQPTDQKRSPRPSARSSTVPPAPARG